MMTPITRIARLRPLLTNCALVVGLGLAPLSTAWAQADNNRLPLTELEAQPLPEDQPISGNPTILVPEAQPLVAATPTPSRNSGVVAFDELLTEDQVAAEGQRDPDAAATPEQAYREIDDQFSSFVDRVEPGERPLTPAEARTGLLPLRFRQTNVDTQAPTRIHLVDPAAGGAEMFFRGEYFRRDYTVFIPDELVGRDPTLVIGYVSDIDVWEQESVLTFRVNGTPIAGEFPLDAYAEISRVEIPLSQVGVSLRSGENTISVLVRHFDRLKCTLQAANDSWTTLFPDLTFLEYTNPPSVQAELSDDFLRWTFANNFEGLTPVSIMTAEPFSGSGGEAEEQLLTAAMFAAQAYGQYSGPMVPEVVYLPAPRGTGTGAVPGLDLAAMPGPRGFLIGTRSQLAGIIGSDMAGRIDGPFLDVVSMPHPKATAGQGTLVVISGTDAEDVAAAAEYLAADELNLQSFVGSARSVRDRLREDRDARAERDLESVQTKDGPPWSRHVYIPAEGPQAEEGVRVQLSELGLIDTFYDYQLQADAAGRLTPKANEGFYDGVRMIRTLEVDLPPDYFVTDDSTVEVLLRYQHDDSLIEGSILNIFLNDNIDASVGIPLTPREATGTVVERRVRLPMSDLRAGRNAIGIEVNMPIDREDIGTGESLQRGSTDIVLPGEYGPCADQRRPADQRIDRGDRRFKLHGDSEMVFGSYPRLAELPNLGILSTTGYPFYFAGDTSTSSVYFALPSGSQGVADTLSAGFTLIAKLGQVVRTKLPLYGTFDPPRGENNHVLIIGAVEELEGSLGNAPLTSDAIRSRWADVGVDNTTDFLVAADVDEDEPVFKGVTFENYAPQDLNRIRLEQLRRAYRLEREKQADLYGLARQDVALTEDPLGWVDRAQGNVQRYFGIETRNGTELANIIGRYCAVDASSTNHSAPEELKESCEPDRTALLLQFQADERNPTRSTLVFTAVDAAHLNTAAQRLVTPLFWESMRGEFMAFGANSVSIRTARPQETFFILTDDMSMTNLRLITANILSRSTLAWALLVAGLVGVAALLNWALVRRVGQNARVG